MLPFLAGLALAGEGMWLPEQVPGLSAELKAAGLSLDPARLADPMAHPLGAIVTLGDCSASFVSADGLIATNHHCVQEYLQYNSSAAADRHAQGYLAPSRAEELWAGPDAELAVVESIEDVTARVLKGVKPRLGDRERAELIQRNRAALVEACEKGRPTHRCEVADYYGGAQYRLIARRALRDVRLVYAPPESVGNYGDEIDNFMWPRHAGDFALLRAYVSPDGQPADHAPQNQPYRPRHWLRIDPSGAAPGELVWAAGYPGSTRRLEPASTLRFMRETGYPARTALYRQIVDTLRAEAERSAEAAARLGAPIADWSNSWKYYQGMVDGLAATPVVEQRQREEELLRSWVLADPARSQRYLPALDERDRIAAAQAQRALPQLYTSRLVSVSDLAWVAWTGWRWAAEREKKDLDRDPGYQDRDLPDLREDLARLDKTLWPAADRALLDLVLARIEALPPQQAPAPLIEWLQAEGGRQAALDRLFASPSLADGAARQALLDQPRQAQARSADPWTRFAIAIDAVLAPWRELEQAEEGAWQRVQPAVLQARMEHQGGRAYPDANGTLRLTFGQVQGYSPRDAVDYAPQTRVRGVVAKAGAAPFDAPDFLLQAAPGAPQSPWVDGRLGDVPVNFTSTLDTTGGNSGSATLNAQGELVGLLFDGNYESMTADWLYDPSLNRSIHVDVRYILWLLSIQAQARWILMELGVGPPTEGKP